MFPHRHPHTIHWIVVSLVLFLSSLTSSQSTATVTSSSGVSSVTQSSWTESSLKEDTQTTARIAAVNDTTFGTAGGTAPQSDTTATTTTHNLVTATTPIPLAATLGLIMPNPWQTLYTELNYTFGFVDAVPRPAPTYGGWMREVVPLIIMSNYTVDVLPSSGSEDPTSVEAIPVGSTGLCGTTAENFPIGYPFRFATPGWYMFVVNQTYMQANITENNQCTWPILQQKSFFATQIFSLAAYPTVSPGPASPTSAYTVWADVSTTTPGSLPIDAEPTTEGQKLGLALGIAGGVLGLAIIASIIWWVRKKRNLEAECLAFSRLPSQEQEAFLREHAKNLRPFLNTRQPQYPDRNGLYRYQAPPSAPPGTMAYALWYSRQLWNNQVMQRQNPSIWNNKYGFEPRMGNAVALGPESNILNPVHIPYAQQHAQVYGPH
ncbi:hypothetical protein CNBC5210 [Cryptococcus deneoformans B-3501A]|uniref:hypothetical protein n=1 Tax=Cryptococcus deneoformans (strain B-3501A) TaxID=283643 RepID=UPI000042FF14|nr:hypothetical protein CNBC5210 [Cryptococcus neoformans var. neoformans B-3501A]EAL21820.1 hypothetical protein CNBC5210 [Cryptococcus neoformans var. neoformans B-3501A]